MAAQCRTDTMGVISSPANHDSFITRRIVRFPRRSDALQTVTRIDVEKGDIRMSHTPHELHEEFPEHSDRIHKLKVENAHFARLATDYHKLNRDIHRMETDIEPTDDFHLEDLKKQRLQLKDEIFDMLSA